MYNTLHLVENDIALRIALSFKAIQQILMITLFSRYVLYEIIDIYRELKGLSSDVFLVSGLRWYFNLFVFLLTLCCFGFNFSHSKVDIVLIPFRINGILIIISCYFLPIVYY